jgi:rod shape-determining protein MreD
MNWVAFGIVAFLSLLLQSALGPRVELFGARPDLLLCLATFLGLYARRAEAVAGAWVMGLAAGLLTMERFGFLAASYGLVALGVAAVREFLFRYRPTTQFATTLVCGLVVQASWAIYGRMVYGAAVGAPLSIFQIVIGSLYSGCLALVVHNVLLRASRFMGLPRTRYGLSGV